MYRQTDKQTDSTVIVISSFMSIAELCTFIDTERVLNDSSFRRAATADKQTDNRTERLAGMLAGTVIVRDLCCLIVSVNSRIVYFY